MAIPTDKQNGNIEFWCDGMPCVNFNVKNAKPENMEVWTDGMPYIHFSKQDNTGSFLMFFL